MIDEHVKFEFVIKRTCTFLFVFLAFSADAQLFDKELWSGLSYRSLGPSRGGRVTAVAGIPLEEHHFYMGTTGGGVWRTDDAGSSWQNISDGYLKVGSVGAVAPAPSDPNVVYVGTGSGCPRGNISIGDGAYKSTDGGQTWSKIGLEKVGLIPKIVVHPANPDFALVAALGNPFGANPERGVYRTTDGGQNWDLVLYVSEVTGAVDLAMDISNPRIIYAGMWTSERKPHTLVDGSTEGGVWKSTDMGESWTKVENGLPSGLTGRPGIAISPTNPKRIWVLQEAKNESKGGLYRSDDGGKKFTRVNRDHNLRQRAWYYSHVVADPTDENTVYVMNVRLHKSIDGGKTFSHISTPHGDHHALWINPDNSKIMINGNDGGACITLNGGRTWSSIYNQTTAEFYRVTTDFAHPFRVYGAQQDNTTISVSSLRSEYIDPIQDWYEVGGGESGHIAVHPEDNQLIYAGTYIGQITRKDRNKGHEKDIVAYPQMHDGTAGRDIKFRFQWNAPIRISPHNPDIVYHCSQFVHKTEDGGKSWETISPDLTTNNDEFLDIPGGPIQHDHTGVELYCTIFAFEESPHRKGELWTGSDDGLVHLSIDSGENWKEITPGTLPQNATINMIELSHHVPGRAYLAAFKYREADFQPYIYRTTDYGANWELITSGKNGIPEDHFVRVVREDLTDPEILYAGTEFGMYISLDGGKKWHPFQLNLPITPITDLAVKDNSLVVATQGRSFWILDDLSPVQDNLIGATDPQLVVKSEALRSQLYGGRGSVAVPTGALIYCFLPEELDSSTTLEIEIVDPEGKVRRTFANKGKGEGVTEVKWKKGLNKIHWDLKYEAPRVEKGAVFSLARMGGVKAPPGAHVVRMKVGDHQIERDLMIKVDPRWDQRPDDLQRQYELTMKTKLKLEQVHQIIGNVRHYRDELTRLKKRDDYDNGVVGGLIKELTDLEQALIQSKSESGQDPINYPSKWDDQLAYLYSILNGQDDVPTEGSYERLHDLEEIIRPYETKYEQIQKRIAALNDQIRNAQIPLIEIKRVTNKP